MRLFFYGIPVFVAHWFGKQEQHQSGVANGISMSAMSAFKAIGPDGTKVPSSIVLSNATHYKKYGK